MPGSIYQSDPRSASDEAFVAGELRHLVAGNRGRLLDVRRTPIEIVATAPAKGAFELAVLDFEDSGARWELPLADVRRLQFPPGSRIAPPETVRALQRALAQFDRELKIAADPRTLDTIRARIAAERAALRERLDWPRPPVDVETHIERREGDPRLYRLVHHYLRERGLAELDRHFGEAIASNPAAGELVKGHAIVLAELGLCPYEGKVVRDPHIFDEPWSKTRRAEHLIVRMAFTQELWAQWAPEVTLYRGAEVDPGGAPREPRSFVAATFSRRVADAQFDGGPRSSAGVMWRQRLPLDRLVMTFLETAALNVRYHDAGAVLVGEPANPVF